MDRKCFLEAPPVPDKGNKYQPLADTMATLVQLRAKIENDGNRCGSSNEPAEGDNCESNWYEWGNLDDETERMRCKQWVARIARLSTAKCMDIPSEATESEWESVMELAYDVKYLLDKHGVSKQSYRHIALWNSDGSRISRSDGGIYVQEVGFVQADLGGETWDASVVLARKIARGSVDVSKHKRCIELGCGTGLLGFTVAHVFAGSSGEYSDGAPKSDRVVVMTDYLPVIIDAVEEGAEKNGLFDLAGLVKPALLDWFDMAEQAQLMKDRARVPLPGTNYLSESEINIMPSNKANGCANINRLDPTECEGFFDLVVAADVLYEVEQCLVIPRLADFLLAPAPEHSSGNDGLTTIPKFIVTMSLRSTHWAEVDAFEAEMAKISGLMLVSKVDSSRLSDVAEWLETLIDTHCADVTWMAAKQDEDDSRQYRTYVFERQRLA